MRHIKTRLDGYMIGGRLLEGVMFDVTVALNPYELESPDQETVFQVVSVDLEPSAISYIKSLGGPGDIAIKYWEAQAREACDNDMIIELLFENELLSEDEEQMVEKACNL